VNADILNEEVRCIAPDGEQLGVMKTEDAIAEADSHGLDLVEVSPMQILQFVKYSIMENLNLRLKKSGTKPKRNRK